MKNGKKPTYTQRSILQEVGLDPRKYLVIKNLSDKLVILHRQKGTISEIELFEGQPV